MKILAGVMGLLVFVCCTRHSAMVEAQLIPEVQQTVKHFVELSTTVRSGADRKRLVALCAGELRGAFERLSDAMFQAVYVNSRVKIASLEILDTKIAAGRAIVRYRVSVLNERGTDQTQETNEREAQLVLSDSVWYVESIHPRGSDQIAFTKGMIL